MGLTFIFILPIVTVHYHCLIMRTHDEWVRKHVDSGAEAVELLYCFSKHETVYGFTAWLYHPNASRRRCCWSNVVSISPSTCASPQHARPVEWRPTVCRCSRNWIHQKLAADKWVCIRHVLLHGLSMTVFLLRLMTNLT